MSAIVNTKFDSKINICGQFGSSEMNNIIKKEPMFFNSDFGYAYKNGGEITKSFLDSLPIEWKTDELVFDSRVHMLMPGWYPAIPGWHHDDVPRPKIPTGQHFVTAGQPDYDNMRYHSEHIVGLLNSEICPTEFIVGKCEMSPIPEGELVYRKWHQEIQTMLNENKIQKVSTSSGQLIQFDWQTFHTGTRAISNGWRWFGRVSRKTERTKEITNEIRVNAQVYLEFPMEGW